MMQTERKYRIQNMDYDEDGNETDSYDSVTDEEELTEYYYEDSQAGLAGEVKKETSKEDGVQKSTTSYTYEYSDDGRKTEKMTETCGGVTTSDDYSHRCDGKRAEHIHISGRHGEVSDSQ